MCEVVAGDLTDTLLTESPSPLALMSASTSIYYWNCHNIQTELNWLLINNYHSRDKIYTDVFQNSQK